MKPLSGTNTPRQIDHRCNDNDSVLPNILVQEPDHQMQFSVIPRKTVLIGTLHLSGI